MVAPQHPQAPEAAAEGGRAAPGTPADPVHVAFDSVFDSASTLYRVTGRILHQLIGLEFRSGRAHDAHIEVVRSPDRVGVLVERMQRRWGAVAHVRPAEKRPDNLPGLDHPERRAMAVIEIHAMGRIARACCRIDPHARELCRPLRVAVHDAARS